MRKLDFTLTGLSAEDLRPRRERRFGRVAVLLAVIAGLVLSTPPLRLEPAGHDFGTLQLGGRGEVTNFTVVSSSQEAVALTLRVDGDSGDFTVENRCPSVTRDAPCTIRVRFAPQAAEERRARVVVSDAAGRTLVSGDLVGMGERVPPIETPPIETPPIETPPIETPPIETPPIEEPPAEVARRIDFQPNPAAFAPVQVGDPRQTLIVQVINKDAEAFRLSRPELAATPSSRITLGKNDCSSTPLQSGASCRVEIAFDPHTVGKPRTTLALKDDRGFVHNLAVTAEVTERKARGITFDPNPLTFASQAAGTPSPPQSVTLRNMDNTTHRSTYAPPDAVTAANFIVAGQCRGFFFLADSTCVEQVRYRPQSGGTHDGIVSIQDDSGAVLGTLRLHGSAQSIAMRVNPARLDFSPPNNRNQSVTVTNDGGAPFVIGPLRFDALSESGAFYFDSPACLSESLGAQASCKVGVHYQAGFTGTAQTRSAELVIEPAGLPAARVQLIWNRPLAPAAAANPTALDFGRVTVGSTATLNLTFTNTGNGAANQLSALFTSDQPFGVAQNGCSPFPPQAQCVVVISFRPTQPGHTHATLHVGTTNPLQELTAVYVEGEGFVPGVPVQPQNPMQPENPRP
jgi:Abnormal spindle-like microcephaly-assoc'd, ASPM-SPD-2-Hydin